MKERQRAKRIKEAALVYGWVLVVWGIYRFLFLLPVWVEELLIKPVVFLGPVAWVLRREKKWWQTIGWGGDVFKAAYQGIFLGLMYGLLGLWVNYVKYGRLQLSSYGMGGGEFLVFLGLALATAVSEEVLFRGYLLKRLAEGLGDEEKAVVVSGALFSLIHLPIAVFVWEYGLWEVLVQLFLTLVVGWGNGFLMLKAGNVVASIFSHAFWGVSAFLFR